MNLKTIAEKLDISPSTVSRIVNNKKNFSVSQELREKVLNMVQESGYSPNPIYQAMRQKKNKQIAIMLPNHLHVMGKCDISVGIDCFVERILQSGYSFHYLSHTIHTQPTYGLPPWKVAGVLAVDVCYPELISELNQSSYPYIVLNGDAGPRGTSVKTDDYSNMTVALEHLYQLGHRRIGYINFYHPTDMQNKNLLKPHYSVRRRLQSYNDFCKEHNLEIMPESQRMDLELINQLKIFMEKKVTALVFYHSSVGIEAQYYLRQMGYRVPDDVSIVGFNDSSIYPYLTPSLTVLSIPAKEMGEEAARLLTEQCTHTKDVASRDVVFKGTLIVRGSTAVCSHNQRSRKF